MKIMGLQEITATVQFGRRTNMAIPKSFRNTRNYITFCSEPQGTITTDNVLVIINKRLITCQWSTVCYHSIRSMIQLSSGIHSGNDSFSTSKTMTSEDDFESSRNCCLILFFEPTGNVVVTIFENPYAV